MPYLEISDSIVNVIFVNSTFISLNKNTSISKFQLKNMIMTNTVT